MKKLCLILAIVAIACGGLFAATTQPATSAAHLVQASGNLALVNGRIAIKDGGKTYYLEGIQRLVGFVDGMKEGASVKAEGYARTTSFAPDYVFLRLTKVTFNGTSYDLPLPAPHAKKDKRLDRD